MTTWTFFIKPVLWELIRGDSHNMGFYEEIILMSTHNIGFYEELSKNIPLFTIIDFIHLFIRSFVTEYTLHKGNTHYLGSGHDTRENHIHIS